MPPPEERARTFANAPLDELLSVLLRQLKRPLAAHGFTLSDADADRLATARTTGQPLAEESALVTALVALVEESHQTLQQMGLTFRRSLDADMSDVGGWESTAEFLELANEKANAELRITLGAALALAFGKDARFEDDLRHLASGDYGDETVIAQRVLAFSQHER